MRLSSAPCSRRVDRFLAGTLCRGPVPELRPGADIKLNPRLRLRFRELTNVSHPTMHLQQEAFDV
jgi:hypothetical protein